jgi:predicted O-linked N-acetylglucosamine transferase (SPINDLY family)
MNLQEKNQSLKLADHYFRINQHSFAKHILEKIIEVDSANSKANELLGYIYENLGQLDISFEYLNAACSQKDCSVEALYYLGSMQLRKKLFKEASENFKKSILKGGEFFEALHDLATAQASIGDITSAKNNYKKCLKFGNPSHELFYNIARINDEIKLFEEAIAYYNESLKLKPDYVEAWSNKGNMLNELKRYDEAITHYDKALSLDPEFAAAWSNKGNTLNELKRHDDAIAHFDKALSLKPDYHEAWSNKGVTLHELKQYDDAIAHFDKALSLDPAFAGAWSNKGVTLNELKRYDEAIAHYDKALSLKPDIDWVPGDLLHTKMKLCSWSGLSESLENISKKVAAKDRVTNPFPLLALTDDALLHKKSSEIYIQSRHPFNPVLEPILKRPKSQKIRVGYFSADFKNHPVAFLIAELFEIHDRSRFEIYGFSLVNAADEMRERLKLAFDHFIEVGRESDIEAAQLCRSLNIDIAVDLTGFTQDARTGIFSYRAAPIQVNYLGYPGTIGADYIDYIVADKTLISPELQSCYSEKVVYLPNSYQINDRKRVISDRQFTRQELGLPENRFVFCCFNNNFKILPATFEGWMRILKAVEGSVLWLFQDNAWALENLKKEAEKQGIPADRLVFAERMPLPDHLARHRQADLFLDTFPYNAHTTTSDALWAGLPVLTLMGSSFASRVAASLLNAISLPELITKTQEKYEELAIELALSPKKLADIKLRLASNRLTTPLFDTPLFTKNLEAAYIQMYENCHAGLAPEHTSII